MTAFLFSFPVTICQDIESGLRFMFPCPVKTAFSAQADVPAFAVITGYMHKQGKPPLSRKPADLVEADVTFQSPFRPAVSFYFATRQLSHND